MKAGCSLNCLLATHAPKAVVFRRGPSKQTCLIAWDRSTDTFTPGQWVKRSSVYPDRSDLSPDGEWLITFLGTFRKPFSTWTVLSRPPYFTAVALWPKGNAWGGGGAFLGRDQIVLHHAESQRALAPGFVDPPGFTVHAWTPAIHARLEAYNARYRRQWQRREGTSGAYVKVGSAGLDLVFTRHVHDAKRPWRADERYDLSISARDVPIPGATWADIDTNGDMLFAVGGALYRLAAVDGLAVKDDVLALARRLADFTDLIFENKVAPYETDRHDATGAFLPRLDRVTKEDRRKRARQRKAARAAEQGR